MQEVIDTPPGGEATRHTKGHGSHFGHGPCAVKMRYVVLDRQV
jgi:hypothetical protein